VTLRPSILRAAGRAAHVCLVAAAAAACSGDATVFDAAGPGADSPPASEPAARPRRVEIPWTGEATAAPERPRGFGTLTARLPGTTQLVKGVRVVAHDVRTTIRGGLARTEIEEELHNETDRVVEGRYAFALPPGASVSRVALWVGKQLVEGEVVERARAAGIFHGIVEDTVRPRDPALLEWSSASTVSLRIFPMPPRESRKIVLAYDEVLPASDGGLRYVYPLSLGAERANTIDRFSIVVRAEDGDVAPIDVATPTYPASIDTSSQRVVVRYAAERFAPVDDFVITFADAQPSLAEVTSSAPPSDAGDAGYAAVRVTVGLPSGAPPLARVRRDRAIVLDASASQSADTLRASAELALAIAGSLDEGERFALLACDSACATYPEDGLAAPSEASLRGAAAWLAARREGGASDVGGALTDAARRLGGGGVGQIVYLGDGAPTAGELAAASIARRLRPELAARSLDLRLFGVGISLDEVVLEGLARELGATYERVALDEPAERRAEDVARDLRRPIVSGARVEIAGLRDVRPSALPNLRLGDTITVYGRFEGARPEAPSVKLTGELDGATYELATLASPMGDGAPNTLVPRFWAQATIAEGEADGAREADLVDLAKRFRVLSRRTSWLVLENDRMFAEFGIPRTAAAARDLQESGFTGRGGVPGDAPASPRGGASADEGTPASRGSMWGDSIGDSFGASGLGLSGAGEGGGGKSDGVGLGSLGTLGHGAGAESGAGFGAGHGRLAGEHKTSAPRVRMGATQVSGRLPPEVIQRIVRMNFGRFRFCYEQGLRRDPRLGGRVAVRFVIGRDGAVAAAESAGSDLPSGEVIGCVVRSFSALSFPQPEGGVVTVVYPIVFAPADGEPPAPRAPWTPPAATAVSAPETPAAPAALHRKGSEAWRGEGEPALDKLRAALARAEESRVKHEALVRGLLSRGRFDEALARAERYAALDPDSPAARELLAHALAAVGRDDEARRAIDALVEAAPRSAAAHTRAARAFQAAGDERRACAHRRSIAELEPASDASIEAALRCRARSLGERDAVLVEIHGASRPGPLVVKLGEALASAAAIEPTSLAPAYAALDVKVTCETGPEGCPVALVVDPGGAVLTPWLAPGAGSGIAARRVRSGTYRTLLVGGEPSARGKVEIRALGAVGKFTFEAGGTQTVASTLVTGA
jgi:Ca-activated chloride channel family protein